MRHLVEGNKLGKEDVLFLECLPVDCPLDFFADIAELEGLGEVVLDAEFQRFDSGVEGRVPGRDEHRDPAVALPDLLEQLHAVHTRHADVGDHQVDIAVLDIRQRPDAVFGPHDPVPLERQKIFKEIADTRFVIDNQDFFTGFNHEHPSLRTRGPLTAASAVDTGFFRRYCDRERRRDHPGCQSPPTRSRGRCI